MLNRSSRTNPSTVRPCSRPRSTARLDGAPTAARIGTPATAAFCTSSKLTRPLTSSTSFSSGMRPASVRSGRATRHTHDYKRHGVVDLYAALEDATGEVTHRLSASHTAADFLSFMRKVVRRYPGRELHVVLDNSSSHGTPQVRTWLPPPP